MLRCGNIISPGQMHLFMKYCTSSLRCQWKVEGIRNHNKKKYPAVTSRVHHTVPVRVPVANSLWVLWCLIFALLLFLRSLPKLPIKTAHAACMHLRRPSHPERFFALKRYLLKMNPFPGANARTRAQPSKWQRQLKKVYYKIQKHHKLRHTQRPAFLCVYVFIFCRSWKE